MGQIRFQDCRFGFHPFNAISADLVADTGQDSSKTITPDYLAPIFNEESEKVASLPGIKAEHVRLASEYMQGQVKQEWPSEFLTSDLMVHLEGVGTIGSSVKKASL